MRVELFEFVWTRVMEMFLETECNTEATHKGTYMKPWF